jgi:hypothetical protein
MSNPKELAPCGTRAARKRHTRKNETCEVCDPLRQRHRDLKPCGTRAARDRHRAHGETCETCAPKPVQLQPCGTYGAAIRHKKHNQPLCPPCRDAYTERMRQYNRNARKNPDRTRDAQAFIEEVLFLNNAGEGRHRILTATGYTGREQAFRDRLYKYGHHNLANQILNPWDLAA